MFHQTKEFLNKNVWSRSCISIIPQKKPPLVWICPETRGVSSVGISPAAFGGRIPLVKHCWAPSAPTEETPLVSSCPETRGVSSEGGGFFCGIVLIMVGAGLLFGDEFCDVADGKPRPRPSPEIPPPSWSPGNPRSSRGLPQGVPVGYASGDGAPSARSASAA